MPGTSTEVLPLRASSAGGRLRLGSSSSLPPASSITDRWSKEADRWSKEGGESLANPKAADPEAMLASKSSPNDLTTFRKVTFATFATDNVARQY
jgi:hypothetical protein